MLSCLTPRSAARAEAGGATGPAADGALDWRAALTVECGFYAARRLHRLTSAADATPGRAAAPTERSLHVPSGDSPTVTAIEIRWVSGLGS